MNKNRDNNDGYDFSGEYTRLYNRYKLLGMNIFEWKNLPKGIYSRHIEKALFEYGQAFFYNDDTLGYMCLGCNNGGDFNYVGDPNNFIVTGFGYCKNKNKEDGVNILNNDLRISSETYVHDYASKMANVEGCIYLNIDQQKFPYIISTNSKNELSMKTLFKKIRNGAMAIFGSKSIDPDNIKVLNLNTPYVTDKLMMYKYELEREILTFFGLNNTYEKKERLLVDEVNSNNQFINRNVEHMLKCRQLACDQINEKYNLDIKVVRIDNSFIEELKDNEIDNNEDLTINEE